MPSRTTGRNCSTDDHRHPGWSLAHLLRSGVRAHAEWADVPLWLSARGLTTGPIAHGDEVDEVRTDFIAHEVSWSTSTGSSGSFALAPMSVAHAVQRLLDGLREAGIDPAITMVPQEVPHPVPFDQDREHRADDPAQFHERPVQPAAGRWDATMGEFLLDYDDPLPCPDPDEAPLQFVTSTYRAGADAAHGDPTLLGSGRPV